MPRLLPLLALPLALGLASCGGEKSKSSGTVTAHNAGTPVVVSAEEYSFTPGTIVAPAGRVEVKLENDGTIPHDFKIRGKPGGVRSIEAGQTRGAGFDLAPGAYEYFCSIGDHAQLGMHGTLRVK